MIRHYQSRDTEALVTIWREASDLAHPFLDAEFLEREADNMRRLYLPNARTWVIEENDVLVGFIALVGDEIGGLFLSPAYHGKGFGKSMVDYAVAQLGPLYVEVFEKNTIGRRFYDRYGFIQTDRFLHEPSGEMTLRLALPDNYLTGLSSS